VIAKLTCGQEIRFADIRHLVDSPLRRRQKFTFLGSQIRIPCSVGQNPRVYLQFFFNLAMVIMVPVLYCLVKMFADDCHLMIRCKLADLESTVKKIEEDLARIYEFMNDFQPFNFERRQSFLYGYLQTSIK